jgi:diguanylate cyclase (GGDEF)-like protein/PAS domain S-box-containing protein
MVNKSQYLIAFILVLCASISVLMAWSSYRRRTRPAMTAFFLLNLAAAIWCINYAFETMALDIPTAMLFIKIEFVGITSIPPLWLVFSLAYSGQQKWLTRRNLVLLWILPLLTLAFAVTNDWHRLFWSAAYVLPDAAFGKIAYDHGIIFWIWTIIAYTMILLGSLVLVREVIRYPRIFRSRLWPLLAGIFIPWLSNLAFLLGVGKQAGLDFTPISFVFSFLFVFWVIFRQNLFDLAPFAREHLMDVLAEGVIVVDAQESIVDINPGACTLLNLDNNMLIRKQVSSVFSQLGSQLELGQKIQEILVNPPESSARYLHVSISPLYASKDSFSGHLLVLRDITERKMTEQMLQNRTEQLSLVMDGTPALMAYIDAELRFLYVNQTYADFYGRKREDFIGSHLREILPTRVYEHSLPYYQLVLNGQKVSFENTIQNVEGIERLVVVLLNPNFNEKREVKSFFALIEDVTEIKKMERAEREQRTLAEALRRTVTALNTTLDFDMILEVILSTVGEVVPHDAANIALLDEQGMVRIVVAHGYREYDCEEHILSFYVPMESIPNWKKVYDTRNALIVNDVHHAPGWVAEVSTQWIQSFACAPIIIQGKVIGFLNLDSAAPTFFTSEYGERLQIFADEAAMAIERVRLFEDANRRAELLATVNRIGLAITAGLDQDTVLRTLHEQVQQVAQPDLFFIALYDEENQRLNIPLFYEDGAYQSSPLELQKLTGLTGHVIRNGICMHIPDVLHPDFELPVEMAIISRQQVCTYVGVPLIFRDRVVGAISMQNYRPNAYTSDQIRLLETIATQATIALENSRLFAQMESLAMTDTLTGIFNRRQFMAMGVIELERSLRYHKKMSAVMIDIDHFKKVNDTYGHIAGDHFLKEIAGLLKRSLRSMDILGRYGGEEFAIIMPETSLEEAQKAAERMRILVEGKQIFIEQAPVGVTASFGVTALNPDTKDLQVLLEQADRAMYAAKQAGRNRVEIYSSSNNP